MLTPAHGALRVLRAGVLAVLALGLSAGGHVLAGGSLPAPGPMALLVLAAVAACAAVTRWRLSLPAAAAVLGGGQLALHEAFMHLAPASANAMGGITMGAAAVGSTAHPAVHATVAQGAGSDLVMALAHATAAVTLALVCARGEDALWGLWAWLAPLAALALALPAAPVRPLLRPAAVRAVLPRTRPELHGALWRRGPPRAVPATA